MHVHVCSVHLVLTLSCLIIVICTFNNAAHLVTKKVSMGLLLFDYFYSIKEEIYSFQVLATEVIVESEFELNFLI